MKSVCEHVQEGLKLSVELLSDIFVTVHFSDNLSASGIILYTGKPEGVYLFYQITLHVNLHRRFITSHAWLHTSEQREIENSTWARGDMKFIFECSTRYLTSELSERVRYRD